MKKIIAMILCVAMVAALSVSAFAAVTVTITTGKITTIDEYIEELNKPVEKTALEQYASALSAAKATATVEKAKLQTALNAAKNAIQAAQYVAIAQAYEDAVVAYTNEVNKAIAQIYVDLGYTQDAISFD